MVIDHSFCTDLSTRVKDSDTFILTMYPLRNVNSENLQLQRSLLKFDGKKVHATSSRKSPPVIWLKLTR